MLTLVTSFRVIRIPHYQLEGEFCCEIIDNGIRLIHHSHAVELEAVANGEPYSSCIAKFILDMVARNVVMEDREDPFTFVCSDGVVRHKCSKHTIARHSLFVRGFIEEYPDAGQIDLRGHRSSVVEQVLDTIIGGLSYELTEEHKYVIQILTPPTDLYYLLFNLPDTLDPSFVISILERLTQSERDDILKSHDLCCLVGGYRSIPDRGSNLAIGYALPNVRSYVRRVFIPQIHDLYPSFTFLEAMHHSEGPRQERMLWAMSKHCDDDSAVLRVDDIMDVIRAMLGLIPLLDWQQCIRLFASIGVKHELLGNTDINVLAPCQVRMMRNRSRSGMEDWGTVIESLEKISPIPSNDLRSILIPYL